MDIVRIKKGDADSCALMAAPHSFCVICQEAAADPVRLEGCGHGFHAECIVPWLQRNSACPVCRFQPDAGEHSSTQIDSDAESDADSDSGVTSETELPPLDADPSSPRRQHFSVGLRLISSRFATREMKNLKRTYDKAHDSTMRSTTKFLAAYRDMSLSLSIERNAERHRLLQTRLQRRRRDEGRAMRRLERTRRSIETIGSRHLRF